MPLARRGAIPVTETSVILVAAPGSANQQHVKRGKDNKATVMVSNFIFTVSVEHQTEEPFWFHSRRYEPVLSRHWSSGAFSTDLHEG